MSTLAAALEAAVRAVAPVVGVSIGSPGDKGTWSVDFAAGATQQERDDAAQVIASFDLGVIARGRLSAYLADKRYEIETGGIVVSGMPVWTDRATQSMLQRASYMLGNGMLSEPIKVKTPGGFVLLSEAQINAIGTAVGLHVQTCFDVEGDVAAAIESQTITTTAEIDAAPWPSNT